MCLSILNRADVDLQHPFYLAKCKEVIIKKTVVLSGLCFVACLVFSSRITYFFSKAHFYKVMGAGSICGFSAIAFVVVSQYRQWKKCQILYSHTKNKPRLKLLRIDGFRKIGSRPTPSKIQNETKDITSTVSVGQYIKFPEAVLQLIFKKLSIFDLCHLSRCCKAYRDLLNKNTFWDALLKQDFNIKLTGDHSKEEYRRLISLRELIYTSYGYDALHDFPPKILSFSNGLVVRKERTLESVNGNVTLQIQKSDHVYFTKSMIFIVRQDAVDAFDTLLNHQYKLENVYDLKFVSRCVDFKNRIIIETMRNLYLFDRTNGKLLKTIPVDSDEYIYQLYQERNQFFVVKNKLPGLWFLEFWLLETDLVLKGRKQICKLDTDIHVCQEDKNTFLLMPKSKGPLRKVEVYNMNNFDQPFSTFDLPRFVKYYRVSGKYVCFANNESKLEIWDILNNVSLPVNFKVNSIQFFMAHESFFIFTTDRKVWIFDSVMQEIKLMAEMKKEIWGMGINDNKLFITLFTHERFIFDFGNFEQV